MAEISAKQKESAARAAYLDMARETYGSTMNARNLIEVAKIFREFIEGTEMGSKSKSPAAAAKKRAAK